MVSDQLQQRNTMLAKGISHLELNSVGQPMASRLMILRYHLKMSVRQLTQEACYKPNTPESANQLARQWRHIHQLLFLLRQVDTEFGRATSESEALRAWLESLEARVYRSALIHLN